MLKEATNSKPLTFKAWYASLAKLSLVTKAVADQGWNPLKYALLTHPKILATKSLQQKEHYQEKETETTETNGIVSNPSTAAATVKQKDSKEQDFII